MTEANLVQVVSTQTSTSQADGSDLDSSVFSLVSTPTASYSEILSGSYVQELPIMCARTWPGFLALRS